MLTKVGLQSGVTYQVPHLIPLRVVEATIRIRRLCVVVVRSGDGLKVALDTSLECLLFQVGHVRLVDQSTMIIYVRRLQRAFGQATMFDVVVVVEDLCGWQLIDVFFDDFFDD